MGASVSDEYLEKLHRKLSGYATSGWVLAQVGHEGRKALIDAAAFIRDQQMRLAIAEGALATEPQKAVDVAEERPDQLAAALAAAQKELAERDRTIGELERISTKARQLVNAFNGEADDSLRCELLYELAALSDPGEGGGK